MISPGLQNDLYQSSPYNTVRLVRPRAGESFASAAAYLETWQREGMLRRDDEPCLYLLGQSFRGPAGVMVQRLSLVAMVRLEEFGNGSIIPRQGTLPYLLEECVERFRRTNAALQPIVMLVDDPDRSLESVLQRVTPAKPAVEFLREGVIHRMWKIRERAAIDEICCLVRQQRLLLASGHHEYEAALTYRDMMRMGRSGGDIPANYVLACIATLDPATVQFRPVHRLVQLEGDLDWDSFMLRMSRHFTLSHLATLVGLSQEIAGEQKCLIGMVGKNRLMIARCRERSALEEILDTALAPEVRHLDVSILHSFILGKVLGMDAIMQQRSEHLHYSHDFLEVVGAVQREHATAAFLLGGIGHELIRRIMKTGASLPPRTADVYPGMPCGLLMNRLDEVAS